MNQKDAQFRTFKFRRKGAMLCLCEDRVSSSSHNTVPQTTSVGVHAYITKTGLNDTYVIVVFDASC